MSLVASPGVWIILLAIASAALAVLHRRWGWVGFGLGSVLLMGIALAVGNYQVAVGPAITTPPRLNWLCIATPTPIAIAATLAVLALAGVHLQLARTALHRHLIINISVTAVAFVVFSLLAAFVYVVGYLGCDTL